MLLHYIKIALRNLRKYPAQTAISVLGLAAGFVCLSLSALWMHYENTYDTMHKDYERIYTLQDVDAAKSTKGGMTLMAWYGLYEAFATDFPEVEAATSCVFQNKTFSVNGWPARIIGIDSTFIRVFDLQLVDGDYNFLQNSHKIALNERIVRYIFPDEEKVVGKHVDFLGEKREVGAVVRDYGAHSIFQFDVLVQRQPLTKYNLPTIFAKLHATADVEAFADKIFTPDSWTRQKGEYIEGTRTYPLTYAHRVGGRGRNLNYIHLQAFTLCSLLLTMCALLNFLLLYLMRLRGKARDMALRIVNGATRNSLQLMFMIEVFIILSIAMMFGLLGVEWLQAPFARFANIDEPQNFLLGQALILLPIIVLVCLGMSCIPVAIVRRNTLRSNLNQSDKGKYQRIVSIGIQLVAAILLMYCTIVMIRQLHFMRNSDYGYNIKNKALLYVRTTESLSPREEMVANGQGTMELRAAIAQKLHGMPMVTHVLEYDYDFNAAGAYSAMSVSAAPNTESVTVYNYLGTRDIAHPSYGFTVVEGELPNKETWNKNEIIVTEGVSRALGWDTAVGRMLYDDWGNTYTIVAVIKDIYNRSLSDESQLMLFTKSIHGGHINYVVIVHQPGMRNELSKAVETMMKEQYPNVQYQLQFTEDILADKMKSETNLTLILGIITAVCILVAVFGVYSIVTLACAQRRKEIALRKIHGATLADILSIFIKEYGLIVLAASAVAFPIGYMIMKEWVAQYVKQAPIAWWIYAVILLAIVLLIALSVGSRVWRTARENPAEVIKRGN